MIDREDQIRKWKSHLNETSSLRSVDVDMLESNLRTSIEELMHKGVAEEEAFLLSARRLGNTGLLTDTYVNISTEEQWKQLFIPVVTKERKGQDRKELLVVLLLSLLGGLFFKLPALFGYGDLDKYDYMYMRNLSLFAFPPVALYVFYNQRLSWKRGWLVFLVFPLTALLVNLYPFREPWHTSFLTSIHLPLLLLFALFACHAGINWRNTDVRMNFIRYAGETFVYAVLIGLGGLALIFLTYGTFSLVQIDVEVFIVRWMGPFGLFGLLVVAAYLANQKKHLAETLAPALARIFTPLFIIILSGLVVAVCIRPNEISANRSMLIWFDILLAFTLALTIYSMSAANADKKQTTIPLSNVFTWILLLLSIVIDLVALLGLLGRLSSFGFSANRSAALGDNLLLLINLILLAIEYMNYLFKQQPFQRIVEMQMRYLILYGLWAAVVVIIFPPLFAFF